MRVEVRLTLSGGYYADDLSTSLDIHSVDVERYQYVLGLPEQFVQALDLRPHIAWVEERPTGRHEVIRCGPVKVQFEDRWAHTECRPLPRGATPILDRGTMTMLGLELDESTRVIVKLPEPYLRA
ncbi:MAG: hypothetical protein WD557_07430 [Dehalococcoidia bacterium]